MATSLNGVIVYSSRYGTTQQYATWIKKELGLLMIDPDRLDDEVLAVCDFLVIGTPVYLGKMLVRDWLSDNRERLRGRRLFFFIVGTDLGDAGKRMTVIRENLPTGMLAGCELFFLSGRQIVDGVVVEAAGLPGRMAAPDSDPVQEGNIIPLVEAVRAFAGNR